MKTENIVTRDQQKESTSFQMMLSTAGRRKNLHTCWFLVLAEYFIMSFRRLSTLKCIHHMDQHCISTLHKQREIGKADVFSHGGMQYSFIQHSWLWLSAHTCNCSIENHQHFRKLCLLPLLQEVILGIVSEEKQMLFVNHSSIPSLSRKCSIQP